MNDLPSAGDLKAIDDAVEKLNSLLDYDLARLVWIEDSGEGEPLDSKAESVVDAAAVDGVSLQKSHADTEPRRMRLTGTQDGLIWLAIEILETSRSQIEEAAGLSQVKLLTTPNPLQESNARLLQLESIQRTKNWPPEDPAIVNMTWKDRVWMVGCGLIALNICFLIGSGIWFWIALLRGE